MTPYISFPIGTGIAAPPALCPQGMAGERERQQL